MNLKAQYYEKFNSIFSSGVTTEYEKVYSEIIADTAIQGLGKVFEGQFFDKTTEEFLLSYGIPSDNTLLTLKALTELKEDFKDVNNLYKGDYFYSAFFESSFVAFLLNQDDAFFAPVKEALANPDSAVGNYFYHYLQTGEPVFVLDNVHGYSTFSQHLKHPFWEQMTNPYMRAEEAIENGVNRYFFEQGNLTIPENKMPIPPSHFNLSNLNKTVNQIKFEEFKDNNLLYEIINNSQPTTPEDSQIDSLMLKPILTLYVGYFGRAPEFSGLKHHLQTVKDIMIRDGIEPSSLVNHMNPLDSVYDSMTEAMRNILKEVSQNFYVSAVNMGEQTGYSDNQTDKEFITSVYANVLGRPNAAEQDPQGINFWLTHMEMNDLSRSDMVLEIIDGAYAFIEQYKDEPISQYVSNLFDNRLEASLFFSQQEISGHLSGVDAYQTGLAVLKRINDDKDSVNQVIHALQEGNIFSLPEVELKEPETPNLVDDWMINNIIQLYIGYFGRMPEYQGFEYHKAHASKMLYDGISPTEALLEISKNFYSAALEAPELSGYSKDESNQDFVLRVYNNILGRKSDASDEGVIFWKQLLDNGMAKSDLVPEIVNAARLYNATENDEVALYVSSVFENREDVAKFFSSKEMSGYLDSDDAYYLSVKVLNKVNQDRHTVIDTKNPLIQGNIDLIPDVDLVGVLNADYNPVVHIQE